MTVCRLDERSAYVNLKYWWHIKVEIRYDDEDTAILPYEEVAH